MKAGSKTLLIWVLLIGVLVAAALIATNQDKPTFGTSSEAAVRMIDDDKVESYRYDGNSLILVLTDHRLMSVYRPVSSKVWQRLADAGVKDNSNVTQSNGAGMLPWLIVPLIVLAVFYFWRKRAVSGGGSMNNLWDLKKTKARHVGDENKARFSDIGGNRQAVELLGDVVDFLRDPQRWTSAGVRIPRGVLVVGPPGTGKTLLARAVAGETQAAFFYTSAAEFVEMFVGIGAARVRDTFEKAAAKQPSVIFIDELDAIGRRRGSGTGTIHEEREQTLNQLLVVMDGMERHTRMVVIAATNRPDTLDPALLRSGRFDRMLKLHPPTAAERLEILKIHTRGKALDASVSLEQIAADAESFTGADLEALANGAGLHAVRRTRGAAGGNGQAVTLTPGDFALAKGEMTSANRMFNRLDSIMVESVSQFAEPTGRAMARVFLSTGVVVEGEVLWMNATHIKLRTSDAGEVIVAKEQASQIVALEGTESVLQAEVMPDLWAGRSLDVG